MSLESGTFVNDLVVTNPPGTDKKKQGDDHLRLIKTTLRNTFPNATRAFYAPRERNITVSGNIVASDMNALICVDTTGGAVSVTLPTLTSGDDGWQVTIMKTGGANNVTVVGTVNAVVNPILGGQFDGYIIMWNGGAFVAFAIPALVQSGNLADNAVTNAKLRDSAGVSVIGRSANSIGDPADIVAGSDGQFLRRSAGAVGFGAPDTGSVANAALVAPRKTIQVLTAGTGATYTTPAGCHTLHIHMIGGGGGGAAALTNDGSAGTASTFNSVNANGGSGGQRAAIGTGGLSHGGAGGTGGSGAATLRLPGNGGQGATVTTGGFNAGGTGGAGIRSTGAGIGGSNDAGSAGGTNTGAGGGGGGGTQNGAQGGGGGGAGEHVEIIIQSPAATYTYTIGGGGNGGAAGTNAGGNGGSGVIIVEEYY